MSEKCKQGRSNFQSAPGLLRHDDDAGSFCYGLQCGNPTLEETIAWIEKNVYKVFCFHEPKPQFIVTLRHWKREEFTGDTFLAACHLAMRGRG